MGSLDGAPEVGVETFALASWVWGYGEDRPWEDGRVKAAVSRRIKEDGQSDWYSLIVLII